MVLEDSEATPLFLTVVVCVCVSLMGSTFIVVIFLCFKDLQGITFRLIFYMSIADILNNITYLLPSYGVTCTIQAVGNTLFPLSSVLWSSVIAYCLRRIVILEDYLLMRYERYYLLYAYGLPLIALIPPAATGMFGYAQGWCWIKAEGDNYILGSVLRLLCFYVPLWSIILYNLVVYVKIIRKINLEIQFVTEDVQVRRSLVRRLVFYPIILIVCYTVVTIKRVIDALNPDEANLTLAITAWIFQCAHGFLNALAYGYSNSIKERLCNLCGERERFNSVSSDELLNPDQERGYSISTN